MAETIEMLRQFYAYNFWANKRVLDSLKIANNAQATRYFAHILIAEKKWLMRLLKNEDNTGFNFWPGATVEDCKEMLEENKKAYDDFFSKLTEEKLKSIATYKNSKGIEFTNTYREVFTHVFFHSSYHRGQIAAALRANDNEPAYTDFIGFLRD
jgi:uncharacterized damage-inducible protein DinB